MEEDDAHNHVAVKCDFKGCVFNFSEYCHSNKTVEIVYGGCMTFHMRTEQDSESDEYDE